MNQDSTTASLSAEINSFIKKAQNLSVSGHFAEAEQILKKILKYDPFNFSAIDSLAVVYFNEKKYGEAIMYAQDALMLAPENFHPLYILGSALYETKRDKEALECFNKAIRLHPHETIFYRKVAYYLRSRKKYSEAFEYAKKGLTANPNDADLYKSFSILSLLAGHTDEAHDYLHNHNKKLGGEYWNNIDKEEFDEVVPKDQPEYKGSKLASVFKIEHDIQQLEYLIKHKKIDPDYRKIINSYKFAIDEFNRQVPDKTKHFAFDTLSPDNPKLDLFRKCFNRPIYIPSIPKPDGNVINPDLDFRKIEDEYFSSEPHAVYFDDFLTEEALKQLRDYCLEATIWSDSKGSNYLGAYLATGFANRLNLYISQEMKRVMPNIFEGHLLQELWSFKYGPELTGICTHADEAAVNINFWITPDNANLDKSSGGLEVFKHAAPLEWDFDDYNKDPQAIAKFLDEKGRDSIVIPHKQNRVVMFNSNLFHKTDTIKFKDDYESRRLNVTMLYGHRK